MAVNERQRDSSEGFKMKFRDKFATHFSVVVKLTSLKMRFNYRMGICHTGGFGRIWEQLGNTGLSILCSRLGMLRANENLRTSKCSLGKMIFAVGFKMDFAFSSWLLKIEKKNIKKFWYTIVHHEWFIGNQLSNVSVSSWLKRKYGVQAAGQMLSESKTQHC